MKNTTKAIIANIIGKSFVFGLLITPIILTFVFKSVLWLFLFVPAFVLCGLVGVVVTHYNVKVMNEVIKAKEQNSILNHPMFNKK